MYHAGDPMVLVNFRLPKEQKERVQMLADRIGVSLSDWLREAVERALESEETK